MKKQFFKQIDRKHEKVFKTKNAYGRNGGAQCAVWEILMEMERFKYQAGEEDLGAVALVLDLAKAFERVSLLVVWAWAAHYSFPSKILRVLCGFRAPEESAV